MKSIGENIKELDNHIGELIVQYKDTEDEEVRLKIMTEIDELTDIRTKLKASKVEGSNSGLWISGAMSIATVLMIMKYEETDVITTKAFNIATRLLRN